MSLDTETFKVLAADLRQYVEKRIELKTLELQEKGSVVAAAALSNVLGMVLLLVGVFFLLVAAGIGLGYLLDNMMAGFAVLSLILIIAGTYIYKTKRNLLKKKLEKRFSDFLESSFEHNSTGEHQHKREEQKTSSE